MALSGLLMTRVGLADAPAAANMPDMSYSQMASLMQMDDTAAIGRVVLDQLEYRDGEGTQSAAWDAEARYGNDYDKLVLRTEGAWTSGADTLGRADLLWDRIVSRWWSLQAGGRYDFGTGPGRGWAALGVAGTAPDWIQTEATAYLGDSGTLAVRLKMESDLLLTQRLVLQPEVELNAYSRPDLSRAQGAGLSDLSTGLRLRYRVRREVAPYVGIAWTGRFGATARLLRDRDIVPDALQWTAGVRVLF